MAASPVPERRLIHAAEIDYRTGDVVLHAEDAARVSEARPIVIGLTAVIVAVTDEIPRVLVVRRMSHDLATPAQRGQDASDRDSPDTLPFGPFDADRHRTLEL